MSADLLVDTDSPKTTSPFEFDPYTPEFDANPHSVYRYLRENAPVYYWPAGRVWVLSKYDDVSLILHDPRCVKNPQAWRHAPEREHGAKTSVLGQLTEMMMTNLAPEDHLRVRKLASPAFTPRAVSRMRDSVQEVVDEVLSSAGSRETLNVAQDFAELIPMRVSMKLFGVPPEHEIVFQRFGKAVNAHFDLWITPERLAETERDIPPGIAMLEQLIEQRRQEPENDLLSDLVTAEEQGNRLSRQELLAMVGVLIAGGVDTTVHALCFSVLHLFSRKAERQLVEEDPALLRSALEEVLRYDNFLKGGVYRVAMEDLSIRGVDIPKGEMMYLLPGSATRDPDIYPDADVFDIRRDSSRNLAFGFGAHYCIGASVARMILEVAIGTLLKRFPLSHLSEPPVFRKSPIMRWMSSLPLTLGPSA